MIEAARNTASYCKRIVRCLHGTELWLRREVTVPLRRLGSVYGGWTISPSNLDRESVVYSFGIGTDISFDLEMIQLFGCEVHAFDPTPKSVAWLEEQDLPASFHWHSLGLANFDGEASFRAPANPEHVSYALTDVGSGADTGDAFPVRRLVSLMKQLAHEHIDVLKMDIEGAEYDAIADIVQSRAKISQLLVEFHHRFDRTALQKTRKAIEMLQKANYRIIKVSPSGEEYSFLHMEP